MCFEALCACEVLIVAVTRDTVAHPVEVVEADAALLRFLELKRAHARGIEPLVSLLCAARGDESA